ncbi:hypothetical protein AZE42_06854, partial [Rhizopogon vesiculosus]
NVEIDSFSSFCVYPSKAKLFVHGDSKISPSPPISIYPLPSALLRFRFSDSIAWTQVYRRMYKKGITGEVTRKWSHQAVKHQRGIVGADLATIAARRNQTATICSQQRLSAIAKAKTGKKEKESKKAKVRVDD